MSDSATGKTQYLSFVVAGEEYAIEILRVREIIECGVITKVPGAPGAIRGVINLRGGVVPVADLAVKMGLTPSEITRWTCVVVVEIMLDDQNTNIGIMADSVRQVIDLGPADIEPVPSFGPRIRLDYLKGMGRAGQKFILLLNIDRVLSAEELLSSESMGVPAEGAQTSSLATNL